LHTRNVRKGGHLQIQHRDFYLYGSGNPTAYGISQYPKIIEAIEQDEVLKTMLVVVTPTLQFGGIASNYAASVSRTIIGTGFVAEDVNKMRRWNDFGLTTIAPLSPLAGAAQDAAVVGIGLARVLQLCDALNIANCPRPETEEKADGKALPSDIAQLSELVAASAPGAPVADPRRVEILVVNARGAPNVTSLAVIKAEDQGAKELDEVSMMMQLAQLQQLIYGKSESRATSIMLQLRHSSQIPQAVERLKPILAKFSTDQPLTVLDFRELNPFFVQTMQMFDTIFGFVFVLIGGIVLFTVSNTMNTTVVERTVEIGTLRAIGLRRGGILALFVTEGALLGLAGAVLGAVLALVMASIVNAIGMPWLPPGNVDLVPFTVNVWGENTMIVGTTLALMCIAVVSAWWPARRAAHLDVVEALRHV
jgi:putative ABC transport system permease protein